MLLTRNSGRKGNDFLSISQKRRIYFVEKNDIEIGIY